MEGETDRSMRRYKPRAKFNLKALLRPLRLSYGMKMRSYHYCRDFLDHIWEPDKRLKREEQIFITQVIRRGWSNFDVIRILPTMREEWRQIRKDYRERCSMEEKHFLESRCLSTDYNREYSAGNDSWVYEQTAECTEISDSGATFRVVCPNE